MRAITVRPGQPGSARLDEVREPDPVEGSVLVQMVSVGVCGTDWEILRGEYGTAPEGRERLVLGHESLGRVLEAPDGSGLQPGDLVAAVVRQADPVPCANCAADEWDMCRNGLYLEHGIKGLDGFCAERVRLAPRYVVTIDPALAGVGVLMEPASVVAKAWEHVERIAARAVWQPRTVLVTGAGPIGLLAAMMGVLRGLEVHVFDRVLDGPKPRLVEDLGAVYHTGDLTDACAEPDVTLECTGAGPLVIDVMRNAGRNGIVALTGVSSGSRAVPVDTADLNRELVLENNVVFGSVNANRRHYALAAEALGRAGTAWLQRLITRRVPFAAWERAFVQERDDVKTVIDVSDDTAGAAQSRTTGPVRPAA